MTQQNVDIDVAWAQIIGARNSQQDNAAVLKWTDGDYLLLLADGMGGHRGGSEASRLIVSTFRDAWMKTEGKVRERLLKCAYLANIAIRDAVADSPDLEGMGSTLVAAYITEDQLFWLSIGDSPMWLIRSGRILRLNEDHSVGGELKKMVAEGLMGKEEADSHPGRNRLSKAVYGQSIEDFELKEKPFLLESGDCLLIGSDGVETLDEDELLARTIEYKNRFLDASVIQLKPGGSKDPKEPDGPCDFRSAESVVSNIMQAIGDIKKPHQDNATLIVFKYP